MNKNKKQFLIEEELFYPKVKALLKHGAPKQYALVSLDFDNFNFINDMFGFLVGDKVLAELEARFAVSMREGEFFTRVHADHFVFFINVDLCELILDRFNIITDFGDTLSKILPEHYTFVCSGGIVIIDDPSERLTSLLDKANFSRKKAKGNHNNTFLYYDIGVSEELSWKKKITLWMHSALSNKEFEMYLQPKINLTTGEISGAEALARWNSPTLGMIMPDKFIPVFEQNGFVKLLDFFILEQACLFIERCQAEGRKVIPVSVNFSKLHIRSKNFAQDIFKIVHSHNVATCLIEIEFTESAFSNDYDNLIDAAEQLLQFGFTVSLDDFGTGYSSLNNLKDIPINIVKIDRGFLAESSVNKKGLLVLSKIVELTKAMQIITVIEGVETPAHLEIAKSVGCDIAQGFYYARPLEIDKFLEFQANNEAHIAKMTIEVPTKTYDLEIKTDADRWDNYKLGDEIDFAIIKVYLDKVTAIQYINKKALEIIGYTRGELRDKCGDTIGQVVTEDGKGILEKSATELMRTKGSIGYTVDNIRNDGTLITVSGRMSYTEDDNARPMAIYVFQQIDKANESCFSSGSNDKIHELEVSLKATVKKNNELRATCEKYSLALSMSDDINYEWDIENDNVKFSDNYEKMFHRPPITDKVSTNPNFLMRVHPDDVEIFEDWRASTVQGKDIESLELRLQSADGNYLWIRIRGTVILNAAGKPVRAVGLFSNISYIKTELEFLREKSQIDPLTLIYNKAELTRRIINYISANSTTKAALFIIDIDNFKGVNDSLGHQFGDNVLRQVADKIKTVFGGNCIVGRLGGDEFTVYYYGDCSDNVISHLSNKLMNGIRKTYYGENKMYSISCSVGIAMFPQNARKYDDLYRMADIALYTAKGMGKDCCQLYDNGMSMEAHSALTPLDTKNLFLNDYFQGDPIYNIFEMLYETKEIKTTVNQVLELLGHHFGVDRVYIFQHSADLVHTSNTYEWCAEGITPEKDNLQNVGLMDINAFIKRFNSQGLNICGDINEIKGSDFNLLTKQGIKALLQCELHSEGETTGFIGFDDCTSTREWRGEMVASIGYVSRILSVFLSKNRVAHELIESQSNYEKMIYNLNGYVYMINMETFDLIYINRYMEELNISVGEKCYKASFGADTPCEKCPARRLTEENPWANEEIYSVRINKWVDSAASLVGWDDEKKVALINCTEIKNRY